MPSFITSAAIVAGATVAMAAPAADVKTHGFSVPQVAHGHKYRNGPIQAMKTYNKFSAHGAVAPEHVVKAAQRAAAQQGSVAANPQQYDEAYLCPVTVGSSQLNLDFDTGSADLWVFSTDTPSSETTGHSLYNSKTGTRKQGYTWDITYQDQSGSKGIVYSDKVVVGGVTATSQAVEAATSVSSQFVQNTDNDGLLGLAFSSINTVQPQQQTTFFDTVKSTLTKQLFTATLKHQKPGSYDFGYIDSSKYTGSIGYINIDSSRGFWEFNAGASSAGSATPSGNTVGDAIADTGTTLVYIPSSAASAYYRNVKGAQNSQAEGGWIFPCSATLPNWNVKIGSATYTVPGSYINYAPLQEGSSTCYGGIQANTGIGLSILGDVFLKAHYAVFDVSTGSPRLGLAKQA